MEAFDTIAHKPLSPMFHFAGLKDDASKLLKNWK